MKVLKFLDFPDRLRYADPVKFPGNVLLFFLNVLYHTRRIERELLRSVQSGHVYINIKVKKVRKSIYTSVSPYSSPQEARRIGCIRMRLVFYLQCNK